MMRQTRDNDGGREGTTGHDPGVRDRARAGDAIALTQVLVSIPSVNPTLEPGGDGEGAIATHCADLLAGWGFAVERVGDEARPSVVARRRAGPGPTLLLNGHLDTVGVAGMTVPPFEGHLEGGRVLGRGACDMKAGVAALMAAARRLAASDAPGELVVALTADEEHASKGMAALIDAGVRADAAIVCEPTSLAVMPAHKGFSWYELTFRGRAAHGSRPEVGIDAVRHAAAVLGGLDGYEADLRSRTPHPLLGHGSIHAGTIEGGSAPSVYPARCVLTLERRTLPGEEAEAARAELAALVERTREAVPTLDVALVETLVRPATEVPTGHALVRGLCESLERCGHPPRIEGMTAWVDAAFLNEAGTPAVCFGPGSIAQAHADDEWVDAREVAECARVLVDFGTAFLTA